MSTGAPSSGCHEELHDDDNSESIFVMGPGARAAVSIYSSHLNDSMSDLDETEEDDLEHLHSGEKTTKTRQGRKGSMKKHGQKRRERDAGNPRNSLLKARRGSGNETHLPAMPKQGNLKPNSVFAKVADFPRKSERKPLSADETVVIDDDNDDDDDDDSDNPDAALESGNKNRRRDVKISNRHARTRLSYKHDAQEDERLEKIKKTLAAAEGAAKEIPVVSLDEYEESAPLEHEQVPEAQQTPKRAPSEPCKATDYVLLRFRIAGRAGDFLHVGFRGDTPFRRIRIRVCESQDVDPSCAVIMINSEAVDEQESPCSVGLGSNSVVDLCSSSTPAIALKARVDHHLTIPELRVRPCDPLVCVRQAVARKTGADVRNIALVLDGEEIEISETAADLCVENGTLIDVKIKTRTA